jgi:hypothetical protein
MRRLRCALTISTLIFACLACRVTTERFLVGTFRAEAPCETVTLVLNRDHSFVQSVRTKIGETNQLTGKWTVDRRTAWVDFEPFLDFREDVHGRQVRGANYIPEVMPRGITMGPIIVKCPDSDHEIDYIK